MKSMFVFHWQVSLAADNQILCLSWGYERLQKFKDSINAVLNLKFHTSQISHHVKNCYQNVTFGKWDICVRSISIILGV